MSECLQLEDGLPLRVVEGGRPEGNGEEGGDGGEGSDCLESSVPAVLGGETVEQEGGGRHLQHLVLEALLAILFDKVSKHMEMRCGTDSTDEIIINQN